MEYYNEKAKAEADQKTKLGAAVPKPPPPIVLPTKKETGGFPSNRISAPRIISIPPRDPPDKHPNETQPELLQKVTGTTVSTPSADTEGTSLSVPITHTSESSQGSSAAAIRVSGARQEKRNEMQPTQTSSTNETGQHATEPMGTAPGRAVSGAIRVVSRGKKVTTDRSSVKMTSHGRLIKEPVFTKSYSIVDHINMVLGLNWEEFKMLRFMHEPDGPFVSKNKVVQNLLHLDKIKQKFARFREAQRNVQRNVQKRLSRFSEPADGDVLAKASAPTKQKLRPEPEISNLNIAQRLEVMVKIMQFFKRSEYHVTPLVSHMILRSNILHCVAAIIETIDPASSTVSLLQIAALDWAMALYCDEKLRDLVLLQYVTLNDKHRVKATHDCNKPPILSPQDMLGYIPYLRKSIAGRIISKAKPVATYNGKSLSRAGELCKAQELPPTHQYHTDLGLLAKDMLEEFGDKLQHDLGLIGLKRILYMRKVTRSESWSSWIFQGNNQVNKVSDVDFIKGFYFPEGFKREFEATEEATQRLLKDITQTWPRQFIIRYNEEKPDLIRVLVAGRKCSDHEGGLFEFHFMVPKCYPLYPLKAMLGIPNGVIEKPFGADVCNEINMITYGQTGSIRDDIIKMAEGIFRPVDEMPDVTTGDTAAILNSLALRYQENSALYKCVVHGMNRWFDAPETGDLGGFRIAKTHPVWGEAVNMWFLLNSRQLAQKASMIHTRLLRPWKEYDSNAKLPSSLTPVRKGVINTQITARAAERLFRLSVVWEAYLKNTQTHTTGAKGEVDGVGVGSLFVGDAAED
ncbi:hypothetical protein CFO_g1225 [Ceratocystis platani]|uniref:UBC core domain-containing protein n=1 Tax=Ceratocystis fimbriata f. sp. platani TaxID=88771 RepID=A0A0F8B6K4_CERFI|nr:hypothetical protein CFO_g1225 [Ceratocystis platani]